MKESKGGMPVLFLSPLFYLPQGSHFLKHQDFNLHESHPWKVYNTRNFTKVITLCSHPLQPAFKYFHHPKQILLEFRNLVSIPTPQATTNLMSP